MPTRLANCTNPCGPLRFGNAHLLRSALMICVYALSPGRSDRATHPEAWVPGTRALAAEATAFAAR
jgi:hypothetical protein